MEPSEMNDLLSLDSKAKFLRWASMKWIRKDRIVYTHAEAQQEYEFISELKSAGLVHSPESWISPNGVLSGLLFKITPLAMEYIAGNQENLSHSDMLTYLEAANYLKSGASISFQPQREIDIELFSRLVGETLTTDNTSSRK